MAQENIKELQLKCEEYLNGWKRERADFLNYKKEEAERIGSIVNFANEDLIFKILPVLDNLLLAQSHINNAGLEQVIKQFQDLLKKEGIEPIKTIGEKFDPATMETVGETESDNKTENSGSQSSAESGKVVEELQKGYTMHEKLIRPAKVKVAK